MTRELALAGVSEDCPKDVLRRQDVITFEHWGFDDKIHLGHVVMDARLATDLKHVFDLARDIHFPIGMAMPLSDPRFLNKRHHWDDELSMSANNTSGFNYRKMTGEKDKLSPHAYGLAIDINPMQNPYIKDGTILPKGAIYDEQAPGTFHANHPIVLKFKELGFEWGGDWKSLKDFQHFEKIQKEAVVE